MKLKLLPVLLIAISVCIGLVLSVNFAFARQGCCSYHNGVCGCSCCDGSPLSATCAPYYPSCNSGGGSYSTCTVDGKTYTNFGEANFAWDSDVDKAVDRVFPIYLERQATETDYRWWENKLNFNNCNGEGYSDQVIIDEVKNSEEYKHLQWLKSHKQNIRQAYMEILGRTATSTEVDNWANKQKEIDIIKAELKKTDEYQKKTNWWGFYLSRYKWWLLGALALLVVVGIEYYNDNHNPNKTKDKK